MQRTSGFHLKYAAARLYTCFYKWHALDDERDIDGRRERVVGRTGARSAAFMCHIRGSSRAAEPTRACIVIIGLESPRRFRALPVVYGATKRKSGRGGSATGGGRAREEVKESDIMTG